MFGQPLIEKTVVRVQQFEKAAILAQPDLALASAPALTSLTDDFFNAARSRDATLAATLRDRFVATMDRAASAPRYVVADQLAPGDQVPVRCGGVEYANG